MLHGTAGIEADRELVERIVRGLVRELDLSCDPDDLRGWGFQGLLEARTRFDADRGVAFSVYAHYRIRGAILDGVRSQGWLKRKAYARLKAFEAADAIGEQLAETRAQEKNTNVETRARDLDDALGKISAAFVMAAVGQSDERAPETPEGMFASAERREAIRTGLAELPERERVLLESIYFDGTTLEEAGARLGLSKSWSSRLHSKALERMRRNLELDGS
jgi:RNA polymerase sigma factor for flagellar operon FliA